MDARDARRAFAEAVRQPEEALDLIDASLLIAQEEYPGLERLQYFELLDDLAETARPLLSEENEPYARVNLLSEYLFDDEKFRANEDDYYDPRNSFLNEVLDRRLGIPLTLSIVYMEVGSRLGMRIEGVGMPGHFLVKYVDELEEIVVDPYRRGIILSPDDFSELLRSVTGQAIPVAVSELPVVTKKDILNRMLNNLKGIYLSRKDYPRALAAVERMLLVKPRQPEEVRDRGLIKYRLGELQEAIFDLETYLNANPDAPDAGPMSLQLEEMRRELRG